MEEKTANKKNYSPAQGIEDAYCYVAIDGTRS
jgi:hypothetical protein